MAGDRWLSFNATLRRLRIGRRRLLRLLDAGLIQALRRRTETERWRISERDVALIEPLGSQGLRVSLQGQPVHMNGRPVSMSGQPYTAHRGRPVSLSGRRA